jgi:hypothetical protein
MSDYWTCRCLDQNRLYRNVCNKYEEEVKRRGYRLCCGCETRLTSHEIFFGDDLYSAMKVRGLPKSHVILVYVFCVTAGVTCQR